MTGKVSTYDCTNVMGTGAPQGEIGSAVFTVPAGIFRVHIQAVGSAGQPGAAGTGGAGGSGGNGESIGGEFSVLPGQAITVWPACGPNLDSPGGSGSEGSGAGGDGGLESAADVGGTALLIAGGGGGGAGGGGFKGYNGGNGGNSDTSGGNGSGENAGSGGGVASTTGYVNMAGGNAATSTGAGGGGGGGTGYEDGLGGGGGGTSALGGAGGGGGGGGSSQVDPANGWSITDYGALSGTSYGGAITISYATATQPTFTSAATSTFTIGTAGSFSVATIGGLPFLGTLTESGALPTGVTFTAGRGHGSRRPCPCPCPRWRMASRRAAAPRDAPAPPGPCLRTVVPGVLAVRAARSSDPASPVRALADSRSVKSLVILANGAVIRTLMGVKLTTTAVSPSTRTTRPSPYLSWVTRSFSSNRSTGGASGGGLKGLEGR